MEKITLKPIGKIHTPYNDIKEMPIQGTFKTDVLGWAKLDKKYAAGLKDLDGFSHAILIYYFHRSGREDTVGTPFLENIEHGIFAIRSPHRPNHLGMSIVKIKEIQENKLYFYEVDMLNGTPLLDIKPYIKHYDCRDGVVSGWIDKHFTNGNIPERTVIK